MSKRKRSDNPPDVEPNPPAKITVSYENLPRSGVQKLQELLRDWNTWYSSTFLPGYITRDICSGSLAFDPSTMDLQERGIAIEDKPQPSAIITDNKLFNVLYEKAGEVPRYDRYATLVNTHASGTNTTRQGLLEEALLLQADDDTGGHPTNKRIKVLFTSSSNTHRCYNCGSYGHSMRECWKELDQQAIDEARKSTGLVKDPSTGRLLHYRYHHSTRPAGINTANNNNNNGSSRELQNQYPSVQPGIISNELRMALGIGELDPPPWLFTMKSIGLPPAYTTTSSSRLVDTTKDTNIVKPAPQLEAAAVTEGDDNDDPDFISIHVDDDHNDTNTKVAAQEDEEEEGQCIQDECWVKYPGINAPIPQGADHHLWTTHNNPAPPPPPSGAEPAGFMYQQHPQHQMYNNWYNNISPPPPLPPPGPYTSPYHHQSGFAPMQQQQQQQYGYSNYYYSYPGDTGYYQPPPPPPTYQGEVFGDDQQAPPLPPPLQPDDDY